MIAFLLKGLLRDRNRSLIPIIIVTLGVMLTVVFQSWMSGIMSDGIETNARFNTGHVKIMTAAYADHINQLPNDLAVMGTDTLMDKLRQEFPGMDWNERILFGGLVDVPGAGGITRSQGTALGYGVDLLSPGSREAERMNIPSSIARGRMPQRTGEVLITDQLAGKLDVNIGDTLTLIGSTMYGNLSVYNFLLCGTVVFGSTALDKGTLIADIRDVRQALDMENAAGEILGFFAQGYYQDEWADETVTRFNNLFGNPEDEYAPVIKRLRDQQNMAAMVDYAAKMFGIMIFVFIVAMSVVLWNTGLLGGLRRYGEFGMRLAIGEEKSHVYRTLIVESLLTGIIGSSMGTAIGLLGAWYLQEQGINLGQMMKNATVMMPTVFRARITPETWFIGFIPGVGSTLAGTLLSGIGIFKRQTAQLFKELES